MTERQKDLGAIPPTTSPETTTPEAPAVPATTSNNGGNARSTWNKINGESVMVHTAHYEPQVREDLRWFFAYAIDPAQDWSMAVAGKQLDVDASVLSKVYNGKYVDSKNPERRIVPDKVLVGIRRLIRGDEAKKAAGNISGFIDTQTSDAILSVANATLNHGTVSFVWGPSHVGKTRTLEEFRRRSPHGTVKLVRIAPSSGIHGLVRQIARVCGISDKGSVDDMRRRIAASLDKTRILVLDEVHELTFTFQKRSKLSCLEFLRELHDTTGCSLLLCGTNILRDEFSHGKDKDLLDQLVRRALTTLDLKNSPTPKDIEAFYGAYGLAKPDKEIGDTVKTLCRQKGVKALIYRLSRAKLFAEKEVREGKRSAAKPTWEDFMEEHELLASFENGEACK